MKKHLLQTIIIVAFSLNTYSQVRIYNGNGSNSSSPSNHVLKFKVDMYEAALNGTLMLYVEKNFNDYFGIELGAGITYYSLTNYMFMSHDDLFNNSSYGYSSSLSSPTFIYPRIVSTNPATTNFNLIGLDEYNYNLGFSLSAFPKYYISEDPTDGFFIGPQIVYKNYNFETPNAQKTGFISQSLSRINLTGTLGYTYNLSDRICIESTYGMGIAFVKDIRNMYYEDNNGNLKDGTAKFTPSRFHMTFGLKLVVQLY